MSRSLYSRLYHGFGNPPDSLTRRDLLRDVVATAAGLLVSSAAGAAYADRPAASGKRVAVIGAGLAGLSASYELASVGYDVTTIEARSRLGGRVVTLRDFVPRKTVEGGGEFIGLNHPIWLAYAKRFGLKLLDVTRDYLRETPIILGGRRLSASESRTLWLEMQRTLPALNAEAAKVNAEEPWKSPDARALDLRASASWLAGLNISDLARRGLQAQFEGNSGVPPAWESFLSLLAHIKGHGLEKFWTDTEVYRCESGNQQLAHKLAEAIGPERVRTGTAVSAVRQRSGTVQVTLADGKTLEVDDVVLATPPATWGRVSFDPPLPAALAPRMATHVKFLVAVRTRFWKALKVSPESLTDGSVNMTWEATDRQRGDEGACLTVFAGSNAADIAREWPPQERVEKYLSALEPLYPGIRTSLQGSRFINWPSDPWTKGSYSCPAPGEIMAIGPLLHKGIDRLHFAGEHTSYAFGGYMEGALQSGARVAKQLAKRDLIAKG
jgi:monoamine oxidase